MIRSKHHPKTPMNPTPEDQQMIHSTKDEQIASLGAAVSWAYHNTDDPKLRKTLKQVLQWHLRNMRIEREALPDTEKGEAPQ